MYDPGLAQLERAITYSCDNLLDSQIAQEDGRAVLTVMWVFRGEEFRSTMLLQPGHQITLREYLWWRLRSEQFRFLPSRPVFEWYGGLGWQRAQTPAEWRRALANAGGAATPGDLPDEYAGRPVRPRPGLPSLSAGAAAVPEWSEHEDRHYVTAMLARGKSSADVRDEKGNVA